MQAALVTSAEVPLALAETAKSVLKLLQPVVEQGTSHALSDAEIAVHLAEASLVAALANVMIKIPGPRPTRPLGSKPTPADLPPTSETR